MTSMESWRQSYANVRSVPKDEASSQVETITALKKELEDANNLIKTIKEKGLREKSIESLAPSAAHAAKIYSQILVLSEDLSQEKQETARLHLVIKQIMDEIESRAPILRKQKEEYEAVMGSVAGMTERLEAARGEVELRRGEAEESKRRLITVERERDRLQ